MVLVSRDSLDPCRVYVGRDEVVCTFLPRTCPMFLNPDSCKLVFGYQGSRGFLSAFVLCFLWLIPLPLFLFSLLFVFLSVDYSIAQ